MKKAFIVGLVVVLASVVGLAFAACSAQEETATTASASTTTTTMVSETTITASTTSAPTTTTTTTVAQEPINLKYATMFQEDDAGGTTIQRFCDYVEEETGGAVTFDVYFSGVLGTDMEELDLVSSGAADMISLSSSTFPDRVPLLSFPMLAPSGARTAIEYADDLVFEDPATTVLIQTEAATNNVMYLGFTAGGSNVFVAREPFAMLSDLAGKPFGAGGLAPAFEALGCTVVESLSGDTYENLSEGVVEASYGGLIPSVQLRWYEVAQNYLFDGTHMVGSAFTINLETWAKLTPEVQDIFREAAGEIGAWSVELAANEETQAVTTLEAAGATVGTLSDEDQTAWFQVLFSAAATDCMTRAEELGIVDDMELILTRAARLTGVAWPAP